MPDEVLPVLRVMVRFARPATEVWDLFFDPVLMVQWLGNEIHTDLEEGGAIKFMGDNAPATTDLGGQWEIKRMKPKEAVLCLWRVLGADTLFLLRFAERPTYSVLEVRHGAIPSAAKDLHMAEHWNLLLANFKSVVELGEPAVRFDYSKYHPLRVTRYDPTEVRMSVLCRAPPSLPFDVWTNPEKLRHFIRATSPRVDRRYAGIYTWWGEGMGPVVFTKMEPEKEIEFSWVYGDELETRVNVRFEQVGEDTLVALHHYGFRTPEAAVGYDIGWASILSELKLVCELGESGIERMSDYDGPVEPVLHFEDEW